MDPPPYRRCNYDGIAKSYAPDCAYYMLRATAAFFSTWTPPALYLSARLLGQAPHTHTHTHTHTPPTLPRLTPTAARPSPGASPLGGILAAGLLVFDGLGVGEGRFVLVRGGGGG
jgi:hypothetical protein